jgi:hypothetical protein
LKDGESPHPTNYRGSTYAKEELQRRKNQRMSNQGLSAVFREPEDSAGPQKNQVENKASG